MSQENVEIVRAMLDTWNTRGIFETIDAFDPDVELVDLQAVMGMQDRGRGPDELHHMAEQWTEIFEDWGLEVCDVVDLGDDFVLAEVRFDGIGRDGGPPGEQQAIRGPQARRRKDRRDPSGLPRPRPGGRLDGTAKVGDGAGGRTPRVGAVTELWARCNRSPGPSSPWQPSS